MPQILKKIRFKKIINTLRVMLDPQAIAVYWCARNDCQKNWGDALNPVLVKHISGKKVFHSADIYKYPGIKVFSVAGSILDNMGTPNLVVWGSGFRNSKSVIHLPPKKILAVRGPLTRNKLVEMGINCPEVYGDPALLFPKFYNPNTEKKYALGIIPHFIDKKNALLNKFKGRKDILMIDITAGIEEVVKQIKYCELIASSSLHGIIASDAYGIPSCWLKISDNILGDDFKYYDYFASVRRKNEEPLHVTEKTTTEEILNHFKEYEINIDLEKLYSACPFR